MTRHVGGAPVVDSPEELLRRCVGRQIVRFWLSVIEPAICRARVPTTGDNMLRSRTGCSSAGSDRIAAHTRRLHVDGRVRPQFSAHHDGRRGPFLEARRLPSQL
jgi:hypothetical protein